MLLRVGRLVLLVVPGPLVPVQGLLVKALCPVLVLGMVPWLESVPVGLVRWALVRPGSALLEVVALLRLVEGS